MRTSFGACNRRARLHARFGNPIPTKTTSPSLSWRAAWQTINSFRLKSGASIAIVDGLAITMSRFQTIQLGAHAFDILSPIAHFVDPLFEISIEQLFVS